MEMQQMMELLLARMDANTRALQAMQENADAMRQEMNANAKSGEEKMEAAIHSIQHEMKGFLSFVDQKTQNLRKELTETVEKTAVEQHDIPKEEETALNRNKIPNEVVKGTMQSAEEHQEIPIEDAAVIPVGGLRKRRRDRNLAAGRRQKPKKRIQASFESEKRSAAACKKVSRHATVAWRKRRVFRRIVTQGICGRRSTLTAAGIRTTRCAKVARGREHGLQRQGKKDTVPTPWKGRTEKNKRFKGPECNNGLRNRGLSQQLRSKTVIKDPRTRQHLRLGKWRTTCMIYKKSIRLEIVKRALRISNVFPKIRKWTLWRGRPPPKRKKR
jgi:hypothetical protein